MMIAKKDFKAICGSEKARYESNYGFALASMRKESSKEFWKVIKKNNPANRKDTTTPDSITSEDWYNHFRNIHEVSTALSVQTR